MLKRCSLCGTDRKLFDFYKDKSKKSGVKSECNPCSRERSRAFHKTNPDYAKENAHKYKGKYCKAKYKESNLASVVAYQERNPIKVKARLAVSKAVKEGTLDKPSLCEQCDSEASLDGHHDDYSKVLDVRWLCKPCHADWHSSNGAGINGDILKEVILS